MWTLYVNKLIKSHLELQYTWMHNSTLNTTNNILQLIHTVVAKTIRTLVFSAANKWFKVSYFYLLL